MSMLRSRSSEAALGILLGCATLGFCGTAQAQACCAGSGVVTPARLALHESALLGLALKAGLMPGSYSATARYAASPAGVSELDLEQDLFAAVRVIRPLQLAAFVPFIETRRSTRQLSETGGGVGDVNLSARYDFTITGASETIPGLSALAGLTAPSGRAPDAPGVGTLATGATGIGAWQASLGFAVEQAFGPWLLSASAFAAQRTSRSVRSGAVTVHEQLATQWTALATGAYVLPSEAAVAVSVSYATEGDATIDGARASGTGHRLTTLTLSGSMPLSDHWRAQCALFDNPPWSSFGRNLPSEVGGQLVLVRSWF